MRSDDSDLKELVRRALSGGFDHHDSALDADPYPVYEALRSHCPVGHSEKYGGFWILSTYDDVWHAYHHPEVFSSYPIEIGYGLANQRPMIPLEIDPPDHAKYRRVLDRLFAPRAVMPLEPSLRELANRLIDAFIERGECEFIADFAVPYPCGTFLNLMGMDLDLMSTFLEKKDVIIRGVPGDAEASARVREDAALYVYGYFAEMLDQRAEKPADDIMSYLVNDAEFDDRKLTQFEILDICFLFFIGGLDTVTSMLGLSFEHLGKNTRDRDFLVENPSEIGKAIEELLRWASPVSPGRTVVEETTIRGTTLQPGDRVLLLTGSAGRDDTVFPDPDTVDFNRENRTRHMAFGAGPHRCLGSHLARIELRIAFEELHRRIPDYRLKPGGVILHKNPNVRTVEHLPLVFSPGMVGTGSGVRQSSAVGN